jgi:hypothetical protein
VLLMGFPNQAMVRFPRPVVTARRQLRQPWPAREALRPRDLPLRSSLKTTCRALPHKRSNKTDLPLFKKGWGDLEDNHPKFP